LRSAPRRPGTAIAGALVLALTWIAAPPVRAGETASDHASSGDAAAAPRIEVRSADLLLVGVVHGERMDLHLSQSVDNAPIRDATVVAVLRGATHAAVAAADGGYEFETPDLALPGAAVVEFRVTRGGATESLRGTLQGAATQRDEDKNGIRQYLWWVLNFGVCIGFLMLYSRRRKAAEKAEEA
jgi:hypothetical protein